VSDFSPFPKYGKREGETIPEDREVLSNPNKIMGRRLFSQETPYFAEV